MNKQGEIYDRGDVAREIAARYGDQMDDAETQEQALVLALKGLSAVLPDALAEFRSVQIHDLGVFALEPRYRYTGNDESGNPLFEATGESQVVFRPAPFLKEILAARTA